ncbi:helix-turn-helix domain-containing protein [Planosporangium mesophilum]|uniref:HTH cro/C1-type domain-containing protein n=1 Tax=Planosporangium mesophilum TaxID=689768 RepID=A0A8J3TBV1_9ACTN|nr:helix-turn-helix transcriptional regulator [Planosporangium mesophilum]NJC83523.1 helix-turn-helix transcriptional regulator [Planosporangium mesophilum]GII22034.1 hypothetical protein Pme01_16310 [Planosporangium mesophilum]
MAPSRQESIGSLLTRVRAAYGWSQPRLAELLCAASGVPTLTRHEISRWEREERIPSQRWLRWLSLVLGVPLDDLERATTVARLRRGDLLGSPPPLTGPDPGALDLASRVATLRRMDDLVGGADLTRLTGRELAAALRLLRPGGSTDRQRRRLLPTVAELAQLACWVAADAGAPGPARRAHRIGVAAATAADQYVLLGHLLATRGHLDTDPARGLALVQRGYRIAHPTAPATARALLLHRVAFAAARCGQYRACEQALAGAERAFERRAPERDPSWLYWLNEAELTAMTGRCYAAVGRPRLAEPLLRAALADGRIRLRAWALYAAWLAGSQLDTGEVEEACATVRAALIVTVRVGSVRALCRITALHPRLRELGSVPAVRDYVELYRTAVPYLPRGVGGAADAPTGYG